MSERLCYIRRSDRGMSLRGLRLVAGHTDDTWSVEPSADPALVLETIEDATGWIRERLANASHKELDALVLDPDGAVCTWIKPEDADPAMLDAAISEGPVEHDPDELEPVAHNAVSERIPRLPRELDFEPLNSEQTSSGARAAVVAIPDVPGRLLKDAMDRQGIRPRRFTTFWHAMCTAWDPGIGSGADAQRIVSSDAPIAAILCIDPVDARLIWAWSREGQLLCAGSMRLRRVHHEHEPRVMVRRTDLARLCADWLGWSSQLGVSPSRVVVLGEPTTHTTDEHTPEPEQPLDAAQLGAMLTQRWPDATLDLMGEADPIGATLQRIAQRERCGALGSLRGLEDRPTRAHRSMFRWSGLALTAAACVVLLLGLQFMSRARAIQNETRAMETSQIDTLRTYDPDLMLSRIPVLDLETRRNEIARAQGPIAVPRSKPILSALETISFVLGAPGFTTEKISINNRTATVTLRVSDIAQAEQISRSLRSIKDPLLTWNSSFNPVNRGQQIEVTYLARWTDTGGES